ncbi:MAG: carboxypeptidase-like regulatory domain-containing protein [Bacteroidales bacterium]|nr:carboxypeptidase-like regulatory domain-containing protein [Bacteroidales bacterium]
MKQFLQTFLLFAMTIWMGTAFGQGSISGVIKDSKTKETIPGANIHLVGTTIGGATDFDGLFTINNVPAGKYNIIISFISYKSDTLKNILVQNGKQTPLNHELSEVSFQLKGVVVQERRKTNTDVAIISSIKQSNLIVSGVSAQQITRSQDKDASEVVKRVPGVTIMDGRFVVVRGLIERYNSVWLNNASTPSTETDQRAFSFDAIPSNMISNILIYKTPAPELPADFAGASIQIFTNNMPEKNSVSAGYSTTFNQGTTFSKFLKHEGGKLDWLGFADKSRNLPSTVPATEEMIQLQNYNNGSEEEREYKKQKMVEIANSFSKVSTTKEVMALPDSRLNVDLSFLIDKDKYKIGNITAINYKNSSNMDEIERSSVESYGTTTSGITYSKHYLDNQYSKTVEIGALHNWSLSFGKNIIEFRNLLNQKGKAVTTIRNGIDHYRDDNKVYQTQLGYSAKSVFSSELGGNHSFFNEKGKLNWTLGYSIADRNEPDTRLITYYATKQTDSTYFPYQLEYSSTPNSESNGRLFSKVSERSLSANLNYDQSFEFGNFKPSAKAGIYLEQKNRDFAIRPFGVVWAKAGIYNQDILHQSIDSVYNSANFNFDNGVIIREVYNSRFRYKAENKLIAGYLAFKLPIASFLSVYAGIRMENNQLVLSGFQSKADSLTPNIVKDTLNFFPSINATINLSSKSLIRLAFGQTVNRPEFREAAPFAFYDFQENVVIYGNDTIESCYINNYDLRFEWYPSAGEMVTLGLFYKQFDKPIEATWTPASSGEWDLRYLNAKKAQSIGIEADIRKSLQFLSGYDNFLRYFKDLTIIANASVIKCKVETDLLFVRDKNRPMYGQSPYIVNAGLYYQNEDNNLAVSLLYNIFGKRIIGIGTPEKPNVYEMPRNNLDLTIIKKFGESLSFKFGIKDLLNNKVLIQQVMTSDELEDAIINVKAFTPGRSFSFGVSCTF